MGKSVKKAFKKVTKTVSRPFKKIGSSIKRVASQAFKAIKKGGSALAAGLGVKGLEKKLFPKPPSIDIPDQKMPAPPAPEPEQYADGMSTPENISRRRRKGGRSGLRIDLNTGGGGGGQGVNIPVG